MNALVPCLIEAWGGYRSGQTGQTVNLLALPSQVRILLPPLFLSYWIKHQLNARSNRVVEALNRKMIRFFVFFGWLSLVYVLILVSYRPAGRTDRQSQI